MANAGGASSGRSVQEPGWDTGASVPTGGGASSRFEEREAAAIALLYEMASHGAGLACILRKIASARRGRATIESYRRVLDGNGAAQPPFPAETVWDVEVRRIRP